VQWIPAKGEYQRWDAVSGEYIVSATGTVTLPMVGTIQVADTDGEALASKIAEQLKVKTGLLTLPSATVEIVEYPPVYVMGSVAKPGEYKFRPGLTVLQALALGGGRHRISVEAGSKDELGLIGELETTREDILRTMGRIARLQSESAGEPAIRFPSELTENRNKKSVSEIIAQEQIIFEARKSGLDRQLDNLSELQSLFTAEVGTLGQKKDMVDKNIKGVEEELTNVKALVDKGIATVSRRSELERAVASLHSSRLDEMTAAMRARQHLSEATRSSLSLRDQRKIDVSMELQDAQSNLLKLQIREDVLMKTLFVNSASIASQRQKEREPEPGLSFVVVRNNNDKLEEFAAEETTILVPGDVVKVGINAPSSRQTSGTPSAGLSQ
jgi:polysaccharide export outer membrane protein